MHITFRSFALGSALLAGVAFAPLASAQSLIQNGNFESAYSSANWQTFNNGYQAEVDFAHSGTKTGKTYGVFPSGGTSGIYQSFAMTPGRTYTVTGYGYNWTNDVMVAGDAGKIRIAFFNGATEILTAGADSASITPSTPTNTWVPLTVTATAPANATSASVYLLFSNTGGGGSTFWDDVAVTQAVPEPASMVAMGLGLLGLAARRRRR